MRRICGGNGIAAMVKWKWIRCGGVVNRACGGGGVWDCGRSDEIVVVRCGVVVEVLGLCRGDGFVVEVEAGKEEC